MRACYIEIGCSRGEIVCDNIGNHCIMMIFIDSNDGTSYFTSKPASNSTHASFLAHCKKYMPEGYPNALVIIDATEFYIERPSSLVSQACTFSTYKNDNTVKVLIGVTTVCDGLLSLSTSKQCSIKDRFDDAPLVLLLMLRLNG